ncbi:MAG TPA: hypothetical protein VGZ02_05000 [Candidatus Baltobacteraceae bacterium]|nr:hypothetical protein [Candidatus Baltobacteraceae bacterium]
MQHADTTQNVYVEAYYSVPIFPVGSTARSYTITESSQGMALSPAGNLYLSMPYPGSPDVIDEYSSDGKTLLNTLTGVQYPADLVFDSTGTLYATSVDPDSIYVFATGNTTPSYTITSNLSGPRDPVVDGSNNLYVVNGPNSSKQVWIDVFRPGAKLPSYRIQPSKPALKVPVLIVAAPNGTLYVADGGGSEIFVYNAGQKSPAYTITKGIASPVALTLDAQGNLYVANYSSQTDSGSITVYAPGSSAPSYTIPIRSTPGNYQPPGSMALDSNGNLYVPFFNEDVIVYSAGTSHRLRTLKVKRPNLIVVGN